MRHNIKYSTALLVVMPLLCALFASCTEDIDLKLEQQKKGFTIVGDPVDVSLSIAVSDLTVDVSTRAEEPVADYDGEDTEDERHVDDLWIFEYDKASGELIYTPQYLTINDQSQLANIEVTLSNNYGKSVVLYVVTNAGSGVEDDGKGWVVLNSTTQTYDGFMTLDELKATTIPSPHPQRMVWDEATGEYVIHSDDEAIVGNISIPMAGSVGEDGTSTVTISDGADILIPVERMFAKLIVRVDLSDFSNKYESAWLNTITIGNIPEYGTVGTLWDGDIGDTAKKADYSGCASWLQRRFNALGESSSDTGSGEPGDDEEVIYPYLIYVPENIQGENQVDGSTDKAKNIPSSIRGQYGTYDTDALSVTAGIYVETLVGATQGEYNTFIAYPGGNETTNFNVRRNCVYRVTLKINDLIDEMLPSANCIVCPSGVETTFWPYYREETGGGYDFEDYLYAYSEGDEDYDETKTGQKISYVKIIWQSTNGGNTVNYSSSATGYIGDNSTNQYVWIDKLEDVVDEYHRRIHVSIPSDRTGNALIGAYNEKDEIIWSWHIWSRAKENDPTTVNTKLYYTYEWGNDGIHYSSPRVAGYTIMNCNLGAMQDEPDGSVYATATSGGGTTGYNNARVTFGTMYQWGRKDPFPPIIANLATREQGGTATTTNWKTAYDETRVGKYFDNENKSVGITSATTASSLFHSVGGSNRKEFSEMIPLTIQNPTVFYAGTSSANLTGTSTSVVEQTNNYPTPRDGNWMLDSSNDHFNSLWGGLDPEKDMDQITKTYDTGLSCNLLGTTCRVHLYDDYGEKSIFDPCPYGWRVSPPDLWLGFTDNGLNPNSLNNVNYNTDTSASNFSGMAMYLTGWREGETSFFPCQGTRTPDGCATASGKCGNYNNATADAGDRVNTIHIHYTSDDRFHLFETSILEYYIKSSAGPLRCVRIDSVQQ